MRRMLNTLQWRTVYGYKIMYGCYEAGLRDAPLLNLLMVLLCCSIVSRSSFISACPLSNWTHNHIAQFQSHNIPKHHALIQIMNHLFAVIMTLRLCWCLAFFYLVKAAPSVVKCLPVQWAPLSVSAGCGSDRLIPSCPPEVCSLSPEALQCTTHRNWWNNIFWGT